MFSATPSEYDDIVNKTTDENLTSENWELILNLCDKVQDEGQPGAHAAIAAILKRLAHRNPNVQLYALSAAEGLSKNLDIVVHREIASKAFTQGLEKLITDGNTHEKVRKRALSLVATWTADFEEDTTLGIMEDCYNNLKAKNYKFEQPENTAPPAVDDEIRRKEEEELQKVIEMSLQDRGGRPQWSQYTSLAPASSSSSANKPASGPSTSPAATASSSTVPAPNQFAKYPGAGYVPLPDRTPSPVTATPQQRYQSPQTQPQAQSQTPNHVSSTAPTTSTTAAVAATSASSMAENGIIVTRVRALHTFEPTEAGELAFERGDVIKVVDRGYKDWWRGHLKGRTGIFPVNYVEAMPEPSAIELGKEEEQEAAVFAQAMNVEKLLNKLRALDPAKDSLADDEEIQELYRSCMALRPKVVKLIDKYSQKKADLVLMNETFVRARTIFDRMMEETLARHAGIYEQPFHPSQHPQGRPDSRGGATRQDYGAPQVYGWKPANFEQPSYGPYPGPANAYPPQDAAGVPVPFDRSTPVGSGLVSQQPKLQGYSDPNVSSPYGAVSAPLSGTAATSQPQQPQQHIQAGHGTVGQGGYGHQPNVPYTQQGPVPYPSQQQTVQQPTQTQPLQPVALSQPVQQQHIFSQLEHEQPIQAQPETVQAQTQPQTHIQAFSIPHSVSPQAQPQPQPPQQQQHIQAGYSAVGQGGYGHQPNVSYSQQGPVPYPSQQQPVQQQPVPQQPTQTQPLQPVAQSQPVQQQDLLSQLEHEQPLQQLPIQAQPETVQTQTQPQTQIQASSVPRSVSPQRQVQPQFQAQPQPQAQPESQGQPQSQPQQTQQQQQQPPAGPPYIFDPSITYADPNVQAWAQYYAQGGRELAGSAYFISIPGLKANLSPGSTQTNVQQAQAQQGQQQTQSYQTQPQPSDVELSYGAATTTRQ